MLATAVLEGEAGDAISIEYTDSEDEFDVQIKDISFSTDCNVSAVAGGSEGLDCNNNFVSDACELSRGCPGIKLGDMNCDENVDGADIQGFVTFAATGSYTCQVDMNQDGRTNEVDIARLR